jgi:uncharacterized protein (UPF0218 family)
LLIEGSFKKTTEKLVEFIKDTNPENLIFVGDIVSRNIIKKGIRPKVLVVDNKVMRKPVPPLEYNSEKTLLVNNPAGTITDEAWKAMKKAINFEGSVKIVVDGEEDLISLIAILEAKENSIVVYGQPSIGLVIVQVTPFAKKKASSIMERMEKEI